MSHASNRYDPVYHFRKDLKGQGCGCFCNVFCWANVWLFLWLICNLLIIAWYSMMVYVLYSPSGTVTWPCDKNGDENMDACDAREVLEDWPLIEQAAITGLVVQCIITICNIFGFVGLWNCIPWMIMLTVIIGVIDIIWCLVYYIMAHQYYFIFWLLIPLLLVCFFSSIYNTARFHQSEANHIEILSHSQFNPFFFWKHYVFHFLLY